MHLKQGEQQLPHFFLYVYIFYYNYHSNIATIVCFLICSGSGWRDLSSCCVWCACAHGLSRGLPSRASAGHWSGVIWNRARSHHVRHPVAEGAQQSVWHPEGWTSHLGRWAALPDHQTHHYWWELSWWNVAFLPNRFFFPAVVQLTYFSYYTFI